MLLIARGTRTARPVVPTACIRTNVVQRVAPGMVLSSVDILPSVAMSSTLLILILPRTYCQQSPLL